MSTVSGLHHVRNGTTQLYGNSCLETNFRSNLPPSPDPSKDPGHKEVSCLRLLHACIWPAVSAETILKKASTGLVSPLLDTLSKNVEMH